MFEPDVDGCDCSLLADELAAVRTRHQSLQDAYDSLRTWTDHIISAVGDHGDGREIMKAAAGRAVGPVTRGSTN
ncbi:hypothetical protein ACIOG4_28545 [Streptomyces microflavus]|uniref:hypothetical protein n=1 Tax=Streptomyces microflavus TaxID=1919 RepID=UPI0037FF0CA3